MMSGNPQKDHSIMSDIIKFALDFASDISKFIVAPIVLSVIVIAAALGTLTLNLMLTEGRIVNPQTPYITLALYEIISYLMLALVVIFIAKVVWYNIKTSDKSKDRIQYFFNTINRLGSVLKDVLVVTLLTCGIGVLEMQHYKWLLLAFAIIAYSPFIYSIIAKTYYSVTWPNHIIETRSDGEPA
jgi:H+/Cl- antiporter ClcA